MPPTRTVTVSRPVKEEKPAGSSSGGGSVLDSLLPAGFDAPARVGQKRPSYASAAAPRSETRLLPPAVARMSLQSSPQTPPSRPPDAGARASGSFTIPRKRPATELGVQEANHLPGDLVTSNLFEVSLENFAHQAVSQFRIDFEGVHVTPQGGEKVVDLSRGPSHDAARINRRRALFSLFLSLVKKHPEVFGDRKLNAYDVGNIFYSIGSPVSAADGVVQLEIAPELLSDNTRVAFGGKKLQKVIVKIQWTRAFDPRQINDDLLHFLEVLSVQEIFYMGDHVFFGNKFYRKDSRRDEKDLKPGRVIRAGFEKNIRSAGSLEQQMCLLQIDPKSGPFFVGQDLLKTMAEALNCRVEEISRRIRSAGEKEKRQLARLLRHVAVSTTHLPQKRMFTINSFSDVSASELTFDLNGSPITVADYYRESQGIVLKYPDLPCVIERTPRGVSYTPPELLFICSGQRVPNTKLFGDDQDRMIKESQLCPEDMKRRIAFMQDDGRLTSRNKYLEAWGIRINERPVEVQSTQLLPPAIKYGNQDVQPMGNGTIQWNLSRKEFLRGGAVKRWLIVVFDECLRLGSPGSSAGYSPVMNFMKKYSQLAREFGMRLPEGEVRFESIYSDDTEQLKRKMQQWKSEGFEFLMAVTREKKDSVHGYLKLYEAESGLITQHLCVQTFNKALGNQGAFLVLQNLLLKTNLKLGGVNHTVEISKAFINMNGRVSQFGSESLRWLGTQRMFVGIDHSHPGALTFASREDREKPSDPTVVGMAYTIGPTTGLRGTYWMQPPRNAGVDELEPYFAKALLDFKKGTNRFPEEIIVFRGGSSEGEFKKIVENEAAQMLRAFGSVSGGPAPRLVVVVVCSHSNYRIMPAVPRHGKIADQNVRPGTVIDKAITNPNFREFVLVAQRSIQGTARPTRCTVVYENKMPEISLTELENVTNALAYSHGVVAAPVSLPAPLYSATDLSKRGRNNWQTKNAENCDASTVSSGSGLLRNDGNPSFFQEKSHMLQPSNTSTQYF